MSSKNLVFRAGSQAYGSIRRHGFAPERIGTLAGASGGAKWLVLSQLDRVILGSIVPRLTGPVHLVGTSIGCWRFACYAQRDPLAAIRRFEEAYIHQRYSEHPDATEITAKSREILGILLGPDGIGEILGHPTFRTHILAVRARHLATTDRRWPLAFALAAAASLNAIDRRLLGLFFERALFFDARNPPPFFNARGFGMQKIRIGLRNLEDAIVATGSIPLVLAGVRNIDGAASGVYRDGGVVDYHLDLALGDGDRLVLYPHFFDRIVPGWFDKKLHWRGPQPSHVANTVLVSPSPAFVARLPNGKIPDRHDFRRHEPAERIRIWKRVVAECEALGEELHDVVATGTLERRLEPL